MSVGGLNTFFESDQSSPGFPLKCKTWLFSWIFYKSRLSDENDRRTFHVLHVCVCCDTHFLLLYLWRSCAPIRLKMRAPPGVI